MIYNPDKMAERLHTNQENFVGRPAELEVLTARLDELTAGNRVKPLVIRGEKGIGRTALLDRTLTLAGEKGLLALKLDADKASPLQPELSLFEAVYTVLTGKQKRKYDPATDSYPMKGFPNYRFVRNFVEEKDEYFYFFKRPQEFLKEIIKEIRDSAGLVIGLDNCELVMPQAMSGIDRYFLGTLAPEERVMLIAVRSSGGLMSQVPEMPVSPEYGLSSDRVLTLAGLDYQEITGLLQSKVNKKRLPEIMEISQGNPLLTKILAGKSELTQGLKVAAAEYCLNERDLHQLQVMSVFMSFSESEIQAVLGMKKFAQAADWRRQLSRCSLIFWDEARKNYVIPEPWRRALEAELKFNSPDMWKKAHIAAGNYYRNLLETYPQAEVGLLSEWRKSAERHENLAYNS